MGVKAERQKQAFNRWCTRAKAHGAQPASRVRTDRVETKRRGLFLQLMLITLACALCHSGRQGPEMAFADEAPASHKKLRIIIFGAHPDDCEFRAGGTAIKWARLGYQVKMVSVTNGDIGHWRMAGGPLAQRRTAEVARADAILGVTSQVLDIHDGELMPTLENRKTIVRLIRQWKADMVIAHRPWDYHPDHRYVGVLVQDAAYMVTVPFFCPDVPALKKNPVFLYSSDRFQKPYPFQPDVVVAIDDVFEQKLKAINELESQVYEGGANGSAEYVQQVPEDPKERLEWLRQRWSRRQGAEANRFRQKLIELYGEEKGRAVRYAEAFEICEYGRQPSREELFNKLFPFVGK